MSRLTPLIRVREYRLSLFPIGSQACQRLPVMPHGSEGLRVASDRTLALRIVAIRLSTFPRIPLARVWGRARAGGGQGPLGPRSARCQDVLHTLCQVQLGTTRNNEER
jgi:hypothetical protein